MIPLNNLSLSASLSSTCLIFRFTKKKYLQGQISVFFFPFFYFKMPKLINVWEFNCHRLYVIIDRYVEGEMKKRERKRGYSWIYN